MASDPVYSVHFGNLSGRHGVTRYMALTVARLAVDFVKLSFATPSLFGLFAFVLLLVPPMPTLMFQNAALRPGGPPHGFYVSLARPSSPIRPIAGVEPILLYVDADGQLFLNSKVVPKSELAAALRVLLERRGDP